MLRETSPVCIYLLFEQLIIMGRKTVVFVRCLCYKLTTINYANTDIQKKHVLACDFISIFIEGKKNFVVWMIDDCHVLACKRGTIIIFLKKRLVGSFNGYGSRIYEHVH